MKCQSNEINKQQKKKKVFKNRLFNKNNKGKQEERGKELKTFG